MMMDDIHHTLNKFLSVVLIFAITGINLWLIGNFLHWRKVFSKDKKCIISSIAISDLVVGIFCLSVEAMLHFEIYLSSPGCVLSYAQIYSRFFSPFVYGMGLMVLCFEIILAEKDRSFYSLSKFLTILVSFIPWLSAILVVIPLTFSGASKTSCWYIPLNTQGMCIWAVSALPAILSLGAWTMATFVPWKTRTHPNISAMSNSTCQLSARDFHPAGPACQSLLSGRGEANDATPNTPENESIINDSSPQNPPTDVSSHTIGPLKYSPNRGAWVPENEGNTVFTTSISPDVYRNEELRDVIESKDIQRGRDKIYLLLVIVIFIFLNIPFVLYNLMTLASHLYGNDSFSSEGTYFALKWMQSSRSFFLPLCWSAIFYFEKSDKAFVRG